MELSRDCKQWWSMLPETERQAVLSGIPNCLSYGLTKSVLPDAGNTAVWRAYCDHVADVEKLEARISRSNRGQDPQVVPERQ
jgi:hypothetical protein